MKIGNAPAERRLARLTTAATEEQAPALKLKPCPFCGERAAVIVGNRIGDFVVCCGDDDEGCGAMTNPRRCESREHAAQRWNRRARHVGTR